MEKQFTNRPDLWEKLGLDKHKIGLWDRNQGLLQSDSLDWSQINYLFILGTGGFTAMHPPVPCPVWYFDSMIDPTKKNLTSHLRSLEFAKGHFQQYVSVKDLLPASAKTADKIFDALLGLERPHRNFAYTWINQSQHQDSYFLSYYRTMHNWKAWQPGFWEAEKQPFVYSGDRVTIPDIGPWVISYILPAKIYNQTWHTLVAETVSFGPTVFTEKIWKPILARRLFVILSGPHYLRDLRSFGFQTFGHVIDESYDSIENDHDRWRSAMLQCDWLCDQDPKKILEQCQSVLDHNFDLAMRDHNSIMEQNIMAVAQQVGKYQS